MFIGIGIHRDADGLHRLSTHTLHADRGLLPSGELEPERTSTSGKIILPSLRLSSMARRDKVITFSFTY
jgi:hypothetical protein